MGAATTFLRCLIRAVNRFEVGAILLTGVALSNAHAGIVKSVEQALESELPTDVSDIAGAVFRAGLGNLDEIQALLISSVKKYAEEVQVKLVDKSVMELNMLPEEAQFRMEREFDSRLIEIYGKVGAEKVKYLCIRFLNFQTGAFGRYAIRVKSDGSAASFTIGTSAYSLEAPFSGWIAQKYLKQSIFKDE